MTYTTKEGVTKWDELAHIDPYGAITGQASKTLDAFTKCGEENGPKAIAQIREHIGYLDSKDILDYGCGAGRMIPHFAKEFKTVYGLDSSPEMLNLAAKNLGNIPNVKYLLGNGDSIPLPDNSIDILFSTIVFHHMPKDAVRNVLKDASRVIRPRGIVAFQQGIFPDDSPYIKEASNPIYTFLYGVSEYKKMLREMGYTIELLHIASEVADAEYWKLHIIRVIK